MVAVLRTDHIYTKAEEHVFEVASSWIEFDPASRMGRAAEQVLQHVRYPLLPLGYLKGRVRVHPAVRGSCVLLNLVMDSYMNPDWRATTTIRTGMHKEEEEEDDDEDDDGEKSVSSLDSYEEMDMEQQAESVEEPGASNGHQRRRPRTQQRVSFEPAAEPNPPQPGAGSAMDTVEEIEAPPSIWVSAATSDSVTLTWLPPSDIYNFPFRYTVEVRETVEEGQWQPVQPTHTGLIPSHVAHELVTGRAYQFRVTASNEAGVTSFSSAPSRAFLVQTAFKCNYSFTGEVPPPFYQWSGEEMALFRGLDTPQKVQDFIDEQPMNHELVDDTCFSPLEVCE